MKYIKKLLLLLLLLSMNNVYAEEKFKICTPTKDYKNYSLLSEKDKSKYIEPIYCNDIISKKDKSSSYSFSFKIKSANVTDTSYNAKNDNLVTPVKNQDPLGTCWAFSAISAVETNALKNNLALYDFSESHMMYSLVSGAFKDEAGKNGRYLTANMDGGTLMYAPSYYFNGTGQLLEQDMPYSSNHSTINSSNYVQGRNIITLKEFGYDNLTTETAACSADFISNIKSKIIKYGSVQATMYMDQLNNFKDAGENYYLAKNTDSTSDDDYPNHGIVIVGWDDTISKDKFNNASRNGAWIIKNSWGSSWSGDGYFYISYDDEFICSGVATFGGVSTTTFDNTYKAADLVGNLYFTLEDKVYFSTRFTKQSDSNEILKRVSFATAKYSSYKVYLSKENNLNDKANWILLGTGTSTMFGIDSVDISSDIIINNDYTIIVEYTIENDKQTSLFSLCDISEDTAHLDYSVGINYASFDGNEWTDFGLVNNMYHCEPNIWAYTNYAVSDPVVEVTNPVVVRNKVTFDLHFENVNTNYLVYSILATNNENVTNHFTITPNYTTNKIVLVSDNTLSGTFTLNISYSNTTATRQFTMEIIIAVEDNSYMAIDDNLNINVSIGNGEKLTYRGLTSNLNDVEIEVYNSSGNKVTDSNAPLGTGSRVVAGSSQYTIVLMGDSTGDGEINSADLLRMVRHLKGTVTLTTAQRKAADCTKDGSINSADLLKVVRFLKGTTSMGI